MFTLFTKLILLILLSTTLIFSAEKSREVDSYSQVKDLSEQIRAKKLDPQAEVLSAFLSKFNSPMQYHAQDFVDAAKTYNLDWRLLPAIAGVESTFGKRIPGGYNAYGWAIYNSDSRYGFQSWRHGMFVVAKGLREGYLNKGLTDPYSMNRIYATSPTWGTKVAYFIKELTVFENLFIRKYEIKNDIVNPEFNTAASSALLSYRSVR